MSNPNLTAKERAPKSLTGEIPKEHVHLSVDHRADGSTRIASTKPGNVWHAILHPSGAMEYQAPDGQIAIFTPSEYNIEASGGTTTIAGNHDTNIGGTMSVSTKGGAKVEITGDSHMKVGGGMMIVCEGDVAVAAQGNALVTTKGNLSVDAAGSMAIQSKGNMTLGSGGGISLQGTSINLNKGGSASGYS